MRERLRRHPSPVLAVAMVMTILALPALAQEEPREGVSIPDVSGDLLDYYTYEPFEGEGPAYMDLLSVELSVDGDELVVTFELDGAVPVDPITTVYILNVDRDEDMDPESSVVFGLGRGGPDGVLWDNASGEPVLLDAPVVTESAITGRVPLEAFGPFEGATASAEVSAEWLTDPDDIFSGVFVADPAPGLDEAWPELDRLGASPPAGEA